MGTPETLVHQGLRVGLSGKVQQEIHEGVSAVTRECGTLCLRLHLEERMENLISFSWPLTGHGKSCHF